MSNKLINKIDKSIMEPLAGFLRSYIYPFATTFFAILNYAKMKDVLTKNRHQNWANFALVLSVIYILFTLGFGIYWLTHPDAPK